MVIHRLRFIRVLVSLVTPKGQLFLVPSPTPQIVCFGTALSNTKLAVPDAEWIWGVKNL
jgi:hypothetical protein